jgi:hypothetical protein
MIRRAPRNAPQALGRIVKAAIPSKRVIVRSVIGAVFTAGFDIARLAGNR